MRNLKRALSLTLASVMLLGMMVVGTSAASFPDVTAEDNVEAIEVLAAVKVLQGYDDGQYHADTPVTRNQMATIICRMMGWRDGDFAGLNPFPDVPDWAANYVAACVSNGIINGRDDGRFHGDDTVTATEAASMMLRALGYTRMPVGANWAQAVAQQSARINLFDGLDVGAYTALTRGDVAQLALNTLESAMVEVEDNTLDINAGNGVSISGGQINYVVIASNKDYAKAISEVETEGHGLNGVSGPIVELGEQVFNGNLKKDATYDAFGRPATMWKYGNDEIGTYKTGSKAIYTAAVSRGTVYDAVGRTVANTLNAVSATELTDSDEHTLIVYQDGAIVSGQGGVSDNIDTYINRNDKTDCGISGKGVVTEVYVDDNDNVVISQHVTYLMQATNSYNSNQEILSVSMKTKPAGAANVARLELDDFAEIKNFAKDDYILYTYSKDTNEIESIAKAETVTGSVDSYSRKSGAAFGQASGWVKLGADKRDYAKFAAVNDENGCDVQFGIDEDAVLVLDANNYILWVDDSSIAIGNYLYVDGFGSSSNLGADLRANAYFSDGTKNEIVVDTVRNNARTNVTNAVKAASTPTATHTYDGWYSYSVSDNKYVLNSARTSEVLEYAPNNSKADTAANYVASETVVTNDKINFLTPIGGNIDGSDTAGKVYVHNTNTLVGKTTSQTGTGIRGNDNTVFLVKNEAGDLNAYTGIKNLPTVKTKVYAGSGNASNNTALPVIVSFMKTSDSDSNTYASLVYIDATNHGGLDDSVNSYDLMYVIKADGSSYTNNKNETLRNWKVVINGEPEKVVTAKDPAPTGSDTLSGKGMYYKVKTDSDNYVRATDYAAGGVYKMGTLGKVTSSGNALTLGPNVTDAFTVRTDCITAIIWDPTLLKDKTSDTTEYYIETGMSGASLAAMLENGDYVGEYYAVTEKSDNDNLEQLYVIVTGNNDVRADNNLKPGGDAETDNKFLDKNDVDYNGTEIKINGGFGANGGSVPSSTDTVLGQSWSSWGMSANKDYVILTFRAPVEAADAATVEIKWDSNNDTSDGVSWTRSETVSDGVLYLLLEYTYSSSNTATRYANITWKDNHGNAIGDTIQYKVTLPMTP